MIAPLVSEPPPSDPFPEIFEDVPFAPNLFAGGADVALTNLALTIGVVVLLLAGASLFNEALEETLGSIRTSGSHSLGAVGKLFPAAAALQAFWVGLGATIGRFIPGGARTDRFTAPIALLGLTALIYSFLEPNFGLNQRSLVIFVSLVISKGVLTLMYEGGKAKLYRENLKVRANLRLFPECILIALVSVVLSRVGNFQPGFVVGFVAAVVLLDTPTFDAGRQGRAYAMVATALLGVTVAAWLLAWPLHEFNKDNSGVWSTLPESIAVSVFVVCLEGLLFSLIPLQFMDGHRIWNYSKRAWLALFIPTTFLFAQVLFNNQDAYLDLVKQSRSVTSMGILGMYILVTFGTWAMLKRRAEQERPQTAQN
ncbi:MAG TPA: FGLLP motif-containing membrane protein [Tepidiformaceae bacterium]|nr:FGLLP motif-containing membrane protein [Tepidiformaceae bacterium]